MSEKKELRRRLRATLSEISPDELQRRSLKACHLLFEQPEYLRAEVIMVFLPLPTEIDTSPIVLRAWQDRKRVLAPKVSWSHRRIMPVEIRSLTEDLAVSQEGIREPVSGIPFPVSTVDLVMVPGLGFDDYGHRLGRGRGFYDRFLAHPELKGTSCGFAFEAQVTAKVPVGPLDRAIAMLVTDETVRRFDA